MKRQHYHIPEPLLAKIAAEKEARGIPASEIVRAALEAYFAKKEGRSAIFAEENGRRVGKVPQ